MFMPRVLARKSEHHSIAPPKETSSEGETENGAHPLLSCFLLNLEVLQRLRALHLERLELLLRERSLIGAPSVFLDLCPPVNPPCPLCSFLASMLILWWCSFTLRTTLCFCCSITRLLLPLLQNGYLAMGVVRLLQRVSCNPFLQWLLGDVTKPSITVVASVATVLDDIISSLIAIVTIW
jgi:hypothetical protein